MFSRPPNCEWFYLLLLTHDHFIQPKAEKHKIPFLVTKSGQILDLMSGKCPRPQKCGGFHQSESLSDGRNIVVERFPLPSTTRVKLKDFVSAHMNEYEDKLLRGKFTNVQTCWLHRGVCE